MNGINTTATTCSNCHGRHPTLKLYRIVGVGPRPLCFPCFNKLDRLGMHIRQAS